MTSEGYPTSYYDAARLAYNDGEPCRWHGCAIEVVPVVDCSGVAVGYTAACPQCADEEADAMELSWRAQVRADREAQDALADRLRLRSRRAETLLAASDPESRRYAKAESRYHHAVTELVDLCLDRASD